MNQTSRQSQGLRAFIILGLVLSAGAGAEEGRTEEPSVTPLIADELRDEQRLPERQPPESAQRGVFTVRLRMPLLSTDWWATTAYLDLDDTSGTLDYDCQAHTYNGHTGNDFAIRDFVACKSSAYFGPETVLAKRRFGHSS